jgi:hypothetical protein
MYPKLSMAVLKRAAAKRADAKVAADAKRAAAAAQRATAAAQRDAAKAAADVRRAVAKVKAHAKRAEAAAQRAATKAAVNDRMLVECAIFNALQPFGVLQLPRRFYTRTNWTTVSV